MCSLSNVAPLSSSPPPPTFFVCICAPPDSSSLYSSQQFFFPKLLHFQALLLQLRPSYLYKVVSASSTEGVNQQCPLKDERIWGGNAETFMNLKKTPNFSTRMFLHLFCRTILVFPTENLCVTMNVWLIWFLSNWCPWTSGTASLVLHMWPMTKRLVTHAPYSWRCAPPTFCWV